MINKQSDPHCLLLVDDNEEFLESIKLRLEVDDDTDFEVITLSDPENVLDLLDEMNGKIDVVITDLNMPVMSGDVLTNKVSHYDNNLPIIVFTGEGNRESKKRLLELGAWDFLEKGEDSRFPGISSLISAIDKVWAHAQKGRSSHKRNFIFRDAEMERVSGMITKLAEGMSPVLIQGEPGTGKELIAHEVHTRRLRHLMRQGERVTEKDYPYLAVNCGALSRTLLESQLFGHKKGSFTGSVSDQDGVFVAAGKGTLFLDEITELDLDLQVKLLRALQEREVTPVGSNTPVQVHARVVTATNRPIQQLVQEGKFRADLYYRINVVNLEVPPLRDRKNDILPLALTSLREIAKEYNCANRELTEEARAVFAGLRLARKCQGIEQLHRTLFRPGRRSRFHQRGGFPGGDQRRRCLHRRRNERISASEPAYERGFRIRGPGEWQPRICGRRQVPNLR